MSCRRPVRAYVVLLGAVPQCPPLSAWSAAQCLCNAVAYSPSAPAVNCITNEHESGSAFTTKCLVAQSCPVQLDQLPRWGTRPSQPIFPHTHTHTQTHTKHVNKAPVIFHNSLFFACYSWPQFCSFEGHCTLVSSRGQGRWDTYWLFWAHFPQPCLCSCLHFFFVSFEDARVVYLPNSVCVIFQCFVSDEVLSSYYWNDNSSFPESKRRGEGGELPRTTFFSVLPPYLPSFSQHMDAGVPRDVFQMPESSEWTLTLLKNQNPLSALPSVALSNVPHTLPVSLAAHCALRKKPYLSPDDFQETTPNIICLFLNKKLALPTRHF